MGEYHVRLIDAPTFALDLVRLVVWRRVGDGVELLCEDGTWRIVAEDVRDDRAGIAIPRAAVEPLAVAVAEWQGHTSHADTEARVLREWLAAERERVDQLIGRNGE